MGNWKSAILLDDGVLLAVAKPAGLPVIAERGDKEGESLLRMVRQEFGEDCHRVHRLDDEASGVLLLARGAEAARSLRRQFEDRAVDRELLAITQGVPSDEEGTIDARIAFDVHRKGAMRVARNGKASHTKFRVLERYRTLWALVELRPLTGRAHQVRVHLANIGCPVVCDEIYGSIEPLYLSDFKRGYKPSRDGVETPLIARLALHATKLTVTHPTSAERVTIEAPLPRDFAFALKSLRKYGT
jgi:RluA family pseudouridine synthase